MAEHAPPTGERVGRKVFLGMMGLGAASLLVGDRALRLLGDLTAPATGVLPSDVRAALPAPGGGWRIYTVSSPMPRFDPATWRLSIDGLVQRPMQLTHRELMALPRAEQVSDFHCVTGWSVDNVRWAGVRFGDLLRAAGPLPRATAVRFVSAERPYVDTLTLKQAMVDDAMLAYEMDGGPLSRPHGAPARLVMPKMYGYKGVKWVQRIELVDRAQPGYWEQRGYAKDAWIDAADAV